jgi:chitin synthase
MCTHELASSSSLPSHLDECHLRPEGITLESEACSVNANFSVNALQNSPLSFGSTLPGTPSDEAYLSDKNAPIPWKISDPEYSNRIKELGDCNIQVNEKPQFEDPDGRKQRRATKLMKVRKFTFQCTIFGIK